MKALSWYAVAVTLIVSIGFNIVLLYTCAKAMVFNDGISMIEWNRYGEGWPEFLALGFLIALAVYAVIGFFSEVKWQ